MNREKIIPTVYDKHSIWSLKQKYWQNLPTSATFEWRLSIHKLEISITDALSRFITQIDFTQYM